MQTVTFRGTQMSEIVADIRSEIGDDAVILSTERDDSKRFVVKVQHRSDARDLGLHAVSTGRTSHTTNLVQHTSTLEPTLREQGVAEPLIGLLVKAAMGRSDRQSLVQALESLLAKNVKCDFSLPKKTNVLAVVGGTGVGKTTTIAKLAARLKQAHDISIGLICADTFRIGAGFQLQTFASLMNLPCYTMQSERDAGGELRSALEQFSKLDLVLIDTAGCAVSDQERLSATSELLSSAGPIESALVLPAPSNEFDLKRSVQQFELLKYSRIILSKLDETGFIGPVLNTVFGLRCPLAYFTTGQRVPQDIEPASFRRFAWMAARCIQ